MLGYEVKRIGVMPVQDRLRFVLEEIEEAWRAVAWVADLRGVSGYEIFSEVLKGLS
jgi:hypothetical protein